MRLHCMFISSGRSGCMPRRSASLKSGFSIKGVDQSQQSSANWRSTIIGWYVRVRIYLWISRRSKVLKDVRDRREAVIGVTLRNRGEVLLYE